jgi:translation initiation factor RLI1
MTNTSKKESSKRKSAETAEPAPPVYFLSLELENVLCFKERQKLDLSDGNGNPAQWTVILGDNGVGKTTLLRCLAGMEARKVLVSTEYSEIIEDFIPTILSVESAPLNVSTWFNSDLYNTRGRVPFNASFLINTKLTKIDINEYNPNTKKIDISVGLLRSEVFDERLWSYKAFWQHFTQ